MTSKIRFGLAAACAGLLFSAGAARADELAIAQYGNSTSAFPWVVALDKGMFQKAGINVTDIRASAGGSADIRAMIAGGLPYAESALASVISATKVGAKVKIVSENVDTVANFVWAAGANSPITDIKDLKGKRITFTTPQSTSEVMDHMLVAQYGLKNEDVKYIAAGGYGPAMVMLTSNAADIGLIAEPNFTQNASKLKAIAWARDVLPPLLSTVGVVPTEVAEKTPEKIRAILVARRNAVEYMAAHRQESAELIAKVYKLDPKLVETVMSGLLDHLSQGNEPYFGRGEFYPDGADRLYAGLKLMGALDSDTPWRSLVDQSFLAKDLQRPL